MYNPPWVQVTGTSAGCPITAGIISIANQQRFNAKKTALTTVYSQNVLATSAPNYVPPVNNIQNYLYKTILTNSTKYSNDFYDVTIGVDGIYSAISGYDICTGIGTPNGAQLCNDLFNL